MWNRLFLMAVILYPISSLGAELRYCEKWFERHSNLSPSERGVLESKGFALTLVTAKKYPAVVISGSMISSCKHRIVAENYFQNKIDGNNEYRIDKRDLQEAQKDIAAAAYRAIQTKGVWRDGVTHEILNIIDDDLLPAWIEWEKKAISEGHLSVEYFPPSSFLIPDASVIKLVHEKIQAGLVKEQAAFALFLLKNSGDEVDLAVARKTLEEAGNLDYFSNQEINRRYSQKIVDGAMTLLSRSGKISRREAQEYLNNVFMECDILDAQMP